MQAHRARAHWPAAVAAAFRGARVHARLTQAQLAERLGVHVDTVRRAELGRATPAADVAASWWRVCGVSVEVVVKPAEVT